MAKNKGSKLQVWPLTMAWRLTILKSFACVYHLISSAICLLTGPSLYPRRSRATLTSHAFPSWRIKYAPEFGGGEKKKHKIFQTLWMEPTGEKKVHFFLSSSANAYIVSLVGPRRETKWLMSWRWVWVLMRPVLLLKSLATRTSARVIKTPHL